MSGRLTSQMSTGSPPSTRVDEGDSSISAVVPLGTHSHAPVVTELTAPSGVRVSPLLDTVSVTWDPASIENAEQIKVVLFDSGVTKIVYIETFNAASDPGAATFTGVDPGTYKVTVASFRTGDPHELSPLMDVTIE